MAVTFRDLAHARSGALLVCAAGVTASGLALACIGLRWADRALGGGR